MEIVAFFWIIAALIFTYGLIKTHLQSVSDSEAAERAVIAKKRDEERAAAEAQRKTAEAARAAAKHAETLRRREELHEQRMRHLAEEAALRSQQATKARSETNPKAERAEIISKAKRPEIISSEDLCMLAERLSEQTKELDTEYTVTEKLDGVRCVAVPAPDGMKLYTRNGKAIAGAEEVLTDLAHLHAIAPDIVLDGELIAAPKAGETRQQTYERTRADVRAGRNGLVYHVFDIIPASEFNARRSATPYRLRRQKLDSLMDACPDLNAVNLVPVLYTGHDIAAVRALMDSIVQQGGEGVMLNRTDVPYQFCRSSALLKCKPHKDADLRIIGVKEGTGRNAGRAGSIIVDYHGTPVGVSSGLTVSLREDIWQHQNAYIGRVVTVRYYEESVNAKGRRSLRFPAFVELRELGKQVSYA